ncbi:hypothetical protein [Nocardia niwae]|uniref:hypothetical protein n=1 Tax=Nocardia niwae TaxID=626084 RepID=UPI0007A51749|nr:hypothetical protein [Nocardia niwae]
MAAAPRTKAVEKTEVKSRWATMRDQARAKHKPLPPYEFDGTEPPTPITAPDSVERATALAALIDQEGNFDPHNLRALFETVCGPAFPAVWSVVKDEPAEVLFPLINDINDHFQSVPGEDGADLPGGA